MKRCNRATNSRACVIWVCSKSSRRHRQIRAVITRYDPLVTASHCRKPVGHLRPSVLQQQCCGIIKTFRPARPSPVSVPAAGLDTADFDSLDFAATANRRPIPCGLGHRLLVESGSPSNSRSESAIFLVSAIRRHAAAVSGGGSDVTMGIDSHCLCQGPSKPTAI